MSGDPFLPYGRQVVDNAELEAVTEVLGSAWLTTGPRVGAFEDALAKLAGSRHAVAVANGTAALHAVMFALGIGPGDKVLVPTLTFAASANCVLYQGGTPVFVDVDPGTLCIDPAQVARLVTPRTRALVAVDYAGQPCDYEALQSLAEEHDLTLIADACHALGGSFRGRPVGSLARLSTFSFHPVKPITTAEGGAITTDDNALAERLRLFRNHGITTDHRQRAEAGSWFYEMVDLGYNYRLSDLHCALGLVQLSKLEAFTAERQRLAARYTEAFAGVDGVEPLALRDDVEHAWHLYVVQVPAERRSEIFQGLREAGIGANVHYIPVHLHPYYRNRCGTAEGLCPVAEAAYGRILSLPLYPTLGDAGVDRVVDTLARLLTS